MRRLEIFVLSLGALAASTGCTLTEEFDEELLGETSAAACSDGLDNDGNGLTDCHEFACLGFASCCDVPIVVLEEEFPTVDDQCAAPDASKWSAWGTPDPVVCDGALWLNKPNSCYDVGVLAHQAVQLRAGLLASVGIEGQPETLGRVGIGFTFQETVVGSPDTCAPIETITPFVSVDQESTGGGYRLVASFDQQVLGTSAVVRDEERHQVTIEIADDGLFYFSLDGNVFATTPEAQPVAAIDRGAYLALYGRGLSARFTNAYVYAGSQCEAPEAWQPAERFVTLQPGRFEDDTLWDWREVFHPMVSRGPLGRLELFYLGCDALGQCGIGRAEQTEVGLFERDESNPVGPSGAPWEYSPAADGFRGPNGDATSTLTGVPGGWDEVVGGYSLLEHDGIYYVWYEGRNSVDRIWRIGLATSHDGGTTFTKHPDNPVLVEGAIDQFDGRGLGEPTVVYDNDAELFRMWYSVDGFLGAATAIGYAVSTDGIEWTSYDRPVVTAEELGLAYVGRPSVLAEGGAFRLWVEGSESGDPARSIYELINRGAPGD